MKTYTFVLLTASALAVADKECVETGDWTAVTLEDGAVAADSTSAACNTACTTAVQAVTDYTTLDFCCESAVTAADDTTDPANPVAAAHACALY